MTSDRICFLLDLVLEAGPSVTSSVCFDFGSGGYSHELLKVVLRNVISRKVLKYGNTAKYYSRSIHTLAL